jgi:hypothetical protein
MDERTRRRNDRPVATKETPIAAYSNSNCVFSCATGMGRDDTASARASSLCRAPPTPRVYIPCARQWQWSPQVSTTRTVQKRAPAAYMNVFSCARRWTPPVYLLLRTALPLLKCIFLTHCRLTCSNCLSRTASLASRMASGPHDCLFSFLAHGSGP